MTITAPMKKSIKQYLVLLFGLFVAALSFNLFLEPHQIVATGTFGFVLIMQNLFHTDPAQCVFWTNIVLIVISFFFISKNFAVKSFAGAVVFLPIFVWLIPIKEVIPDTLLSVLVAGVLNGVCVICLFYSNGSAGGTTIVGKLISKYAKVKFSTGIAISDGTVVLCGLALFGIQNTCYGLLSITVTRIIAHLAETGFHKTNCVFIISKQFEHIKAQLAAVDHEIKVTFLHVQGGYENNKDQTIICAIIETTHLKKLRKIVAAIDQESLIIVSSVSEIYGKGFISDLV